MVAFQQVALISNAHLAPPKTACGPTAGRLTEVICSRAGVISSPASAQYPLVMEQTILAQEFRGEL